MVNCTEKGRGRMIDEREPAKLAAQVELVVLDVDGVLTDGTFMWDGHGNELKRFSFADVMGISLARSAGLRFAIVSGEANSLIDHLAEKLDITDVWQGVRDKACCIRELLERYGLDGERVCYVGDDVNDIPAMKMVGLPVAVANANSRVLPHVSWVTTNPGGGGAVREILDVIVEAKKSARSEAVA